MKLTKINPTEVIAQIKKEKQRKEKLNKGLESKKSKKDKKSNVNDDENPADAEQQSPEYDILSRIQIKHIILDFSCVNYIDSQGVNCIQQVK
jgi:hypothetical protein